MHGLQARHPLRCTDHARALGSDRKGRISIVIYAVAIPLAFFATAASFALYIAVALLWLVPDRRIERTLAR